MQREWIRGLTTHVAYHSLFLGDIVPPVTIKTFSKGAHTWMDKRPVEKFALRPKFPHSVALTQEYDCSILIKSSYHY